MNILFTSAGRRGYLLSYFREVIGKSGRIYAGNSIPNAPSFLYADDSVITPQIYDDEYIPFLLDYCKKKDIDVIIPLFDIDLPILSKNKGLFYSNGIEVIVSDISAVSICNDKWKTYIFCKNNNICTPKTFLSIEDTKIALQKGEVSFPLFVKPRWGMGSISVFSVNNLLELEVLYGKVKDEIFKTYLKFESVEDSEQCIVIQEKLLGQEHGLDIINDLNGNYCNTIVKKKIAMRSGETDCAEVIRNSELEKLGKKISEKLKHIANLDADVFMVGEKPYLLEMNARFGGGYPFSHFAGIDLPRAIVKWLKNIEIEDELIVKRYNVFAQKDIRMIDLTSIMINSGE